MKRFEKVLVTGGCGFIGANFIQYLFDESGYKGSVVNIDKLTYSGNPENLAAVEKKFGGKRYVFEKTDIVDHAKIDDLFERYGFHAV